MPPSISASNISPFYFSVCIRCVATCEVATDLIQYVERGNMAAENSVKDLHDKLSHSFTMH